MVRRSSQVQRQRLVVEVGKDAQKSERYGRYTTLTDAQTLKGGSPSS